MSDPESPGGGQPRRKARSSRRPRRRARRPAASRSGNGGDATPASPAPKRPRAQLRRDLHALPTVNEAPFASMAIVTSGIHPSTARLVAVGIVLYAPNADDPTLPGKEIYAFTRHMNTGEESGPVHLHGYPVSQLAQSLGFSSCAPLFREALDGRTLILHQAAYTWGFLKNEYRMLQRAQNKARRGRGPKNVQQPKPVAIVDTLATARRQSVECYDSRLRAIVDCYNDPASGTHTSVDAPEEALLGLGAVASQQRRETDPDQLLAADARLTAALAIAQRGAGPVAQLDPDELTADKFGLQRSRRRVDAALAPRTHVNPGTWCEGEPLVEGMEFVVSPDVAMDPDELIARGVAAGLAYSEKLNRRSSLVVCNTNHELRGKAMHAERKKIPLMDDTMFLELLEDVRLGEKEPVPVKPGTGVRPRTFGLTGGGSVPSESLGKMQQAATQKRAGNKAGGRGSAGGRAGGRNGQGGRGGQRGGGRAGGQNGGDQKVQDGSRDSASHGGGHNGQRRRGRRGGRRRRGGRSNGNGSRGNGNGGGGSSSGTGSASRPLDA